MNRHLQTLAALVVGGLVWALPANAADHKRVALVLGNSAYQNVARLPNPSRDATSIAKMLKDAGFEVILQQDVGNLEFKRAIRRFGDAMLDADIALVFYAGHGIEVRGTNYLIPVDAKLASDRDAEDEAVSLDRLVQEIEDNGGKAKQLRLIILDACRDNPFVKTMKVARTAPARTRSAGGANGLSPVQPTSSDMLIAYAAKQGSTAEDGDGDHSPFTTALLRSLTVPGLDIRLAFGRIRDDVLRATDMKQEPFVYGSLGGGVIPLVPLPQTQSAGADDATMKSDYDRVAKIGSKKAFEVFVGTYKSGFYSDLARAQLEELNKLDQPRLASLPSAPAPSDRPSTEETRAWARIEGTTDTGTLQDFVRRFPKSPLAIAAQSRIDLLQRNAREREAEREAKVGAEREAALRAKLADVERLKAEREAAAQRAADERRAKAAAEAERQRLEREAQKQREEEAKHAADAAAERKRVEREAQKQREEEAKRAADAAAERKRVEREAQKQREEEAKRAAAAENERRRLEREAHKQREEEAKRVAAAEAERQRQEREAQKQREEEAKRTAEAKSAAEKRASEEAAKRAELERFAKAAELERQTKEHEAAAKRADQERLAKVAELDRQKKEQEVTTKRAEQERLAKAAELDRQKNEQEAAVKRAEEERLAKTAELERKKKEQDAATKRAEAERIAKAAELDRVKQDREVAAKREEEEQAKKQAELNTQLQRAEEDRKAWAETEKRKSNQVAALSSPGDKPSTNANSAALVTAAQKQLARIGCYDGKVDGAWSDGTQSAVRRYFLQQGRLPKAIEVNDGLVASLEKEKSRVCPLVCRDGFVSNGDVCVAKEKSKPAPSVASKERDEKRERARERDREREKEKHQARAKQPKPQARQEARASRGGGGGGGGGHGGGSVSGVGF